MSLFVVDTAITSTPGPLDTEISVLVVDGWLPGSQW
jgi:hypothetical protein